MRALRSIVIAAAALAAGACSHQDRTTSDSAAGTVSADKADIGHPLSVTPTEGGAAQVTSTDARSVRLADKYKLTDQSFQAFVKASDTLAILRRSDPAVARTLDQQISDAANGTRVTATDAGVKHLESNVAVNNAIVASGISVPDYFVASIAIGQAERFLDDPKAAPPTPTLQDNINYLKAHRAELQAMRTRDKAQ